MSRAVLLLTVTLAGSPAARAAGRDGSDLVVVALGEEPTLAHEVQAVAERLRAAGHHVLGPDETSQRLRRVPADCQPGAPAAPEGTAPASCQPAVDDAVAAALLKSAARKDAAFDSQAADELRRQVLELYDLTPQPSPRLRQLAGEAAVARAAALFTAGHQVEAEVAAREAMRRFGDAPVDPRRYAPRLQQLFTAARATLAAGPAVELRVGSSGPGRLFADGNELGLLARELVVRLPPGRYRLWVVGDDGEASLPYGVELGEAPAAVELDPELDRHLALGEPTRLSCSGAACEELLVRLCARLGVEHALGVGTAPSPAARLLRVGRRGARQWVPLERAASLDDFLTGTRPPPPADDGRPSFFARHRWALAAAALSVAAVGAGAGFGLRSRDQLAKAGRPGITQLEHDDLNAAGRRNALVADGLFVAGGAALAGALLSWRAEW